MFSCEFSEIFKNTYFEEHMRMDASASVFVSISFSVILSSNLSICVFWNLEHCGYSF